GDGTSFSSKSFLHHQADDFFPFYASLYTGLSKPPAPGSIQGVIDFASLVDSDCWGSLTWLKPLQSAKGPYSSGFVTSATFRGSRYQRRSQMLGFSDPTAGIASFEL